MIMDEIKLIFLTDMHLVSENSFLGINTFDSFSSVVDDVIQNHSNADFVIFGGDLVQDQSKDSYAFFKSQINRIKALKLFARGNHDVCDIFFNSLKKDTSTFFSKNDWRIFNLETYSKGNIFGEVKKDDLNRLKLEANKRKDKFFFIFMHHNLFLTHSPWLDIHITKERTSILDQIIDIDNIKLVVNGHVHQETRNIYNGLNFISAPSTSIQFTSGQKSFKLARLQPGYLVIKLKNNGTWNVSCQRVKGEFGSPEINPSAY